MIQFFFFLLINFNDLFDQFFSALFLQTTIFSKKVKIEKKLEKIK